MARVVGAKLPKSSPLPPLQPNFTPSEASLEVLQLLNADDCESSEMSEDAIRHTLQEWLRTYDAEQNQYTSVTVFAEMKLRQALVVTSKLGLPNPIRTAAVCSCFDRVASLFHRYEGLLRTLRGELLRSIYVDYRPGAVIGGGAQAYSMCTPYFEELRKEKRKTAELRGLIKEWGEERTAALQAAEERRKSLELVIEQLKRLAADSQSPAPPASAGAGAEAEAEEGKEMTGSDRLLQLVPDLEAAVESVRQEHEAAFLDPVSKITQLQESLSQYQQLRLLQRGLRELGPTLMAELPPAERASMAASLLEQVPEAELQSLLLRLMLLRQPPQLLELLEAAAAELDQSLAAELVVKLAARCFDDTPMAAASGRRLSVARRSSLSGASQARRASGMVAGQAAPPAPVAFAALVRGVLGAAPEEVRVLALTDVLRQQEVVPRARRAALAEALGAPVAEVDELRLELSRSRESLRALGPQAQAPEPERFQQLFGVDLPLPLPGGASAPAPGEMGALPPHAARQLVGELFALKLAETGELPGDAAGAFRPARSRRGEMPPPFARFAYEALLRKHGVRSTARQALRMLLAAVEPTPDDASGRTPTPTPPSEGDPFLLFAPMCGIGGAAAPWAPAKVDFFFHALGKVVALRPNVSLHALLVAPRALVPVAGLRQLASAWFGGDASRALLERLQVLADNPTATVEGGGGSGNAAQPAAALEELLPLLVQAWEIEHAAHEQRLRSAFAAAQPSSGVLTRGAFAALVRSLEGAAAAAEPAIDDERVGAMYEAALDCSSGLLKQPESDVLLLEAFVYVCRSAGL